MRHAKAFRKFGRTPAHRRAMFRNMATSLLKHERITTTLAKAKDLRRISEKLITLGKEDTLHRRRQALAFIFEKPVVHKLFAELGPKFKGRPGGYTRVIKLGKRPGDAADMAIIELVQEDLKAKPKKKARKAKPAAKAKASEAKGGKAADPAIAEDSKEQATSDEAKTTEGE